MSPSQLLPLLIGPSERPLVWVGGRPISAGGFLARAAAVARQLPPGAAMLNLCEGRHHFLLAFVAAMLRGQTTLLPPSRAPAVIEEIKARMAGAYLCDDGFVARADASGPVPVDCTVDSGFEAFTAFTSGSTGKPRPQRKRWGSVTRSTELNLRRIRAAMKNGGAESPPSIVATVPAQHMYGMETSVLLPLLGGFSVHGGRPLFPADVAQALAEVIPPRILVTTPVHLRTLTGAGIEFPSTALIVTATAPLEAELACTAEDAFDAPVLDLLGSTETCVIASRRPAREISWALYDGVRLVSRADATRVEAPWFEEPAELQDLVEYCPDGRFLLKGRNADMIEVAGKRASLAELTRRMLAIPGVHDAVVFQPDDVQGSGPVGRVSALVVAPGLSEAEVIGALRNSIDAAFLPRPLVMVAQLPRSATGKLPRAELLAALR